MLLHKKITWCWLAFICVLSIASFAQTKVTHLDTLKNINSLNYHRATNNQLGVIGNDFLSKEGIGTSMADGDYTEEWKPILLDNETQGYKRTICGEMTDNERRSPTPPFGEDDDFNFYIIPGLQSKELYDKAMRKYNTKPEFHAEIDIPSSGWNKFVKHSNLPLSKVDCMCAYGAFVIDQPDDDDHNFIEVHPADQIWWTEKQVDAFTGREIGLIHNLMAFQDNSGRFSKWTKNPGTYTFYLPFEIVNKKKPVNYIVKPMLQNNLVRTGKNFKQYLLVYKQDTLVNLKLTNDFDFAEISFENVGYIPNSVFSPFIAGFVAITVKLHYPTLSFGLNTGYSHLKVWKENSQQEDIPKLMAQLPGAPVEKDWILQVSLDSIKCLYAKDDGIITDGNVVEVYGFLGARIKNDISGKGKSLLDIRGNNGLLWAALDDIGQSIHFRTNMVKILDEKRFFRVSSRDSLILSGKMYEDDASGDNNPTSRDDAWNNTDDDDYLGAHSRSFGIRNISEIGKLPVRFEFRDNESRIVCFITVQKRPAN